MNFIACLIAYPLYLLSLPPLITKFLTNSIKFNKPVSRNENKFIASKLQMLTLISGILFGNKDTLLLPQNTISDQVSETVGSKTI